MGRSGIYNEAIRNGSIKKNPKKKGSGGWILARKEWRDDNKRTQDLEILLLQPHNPYCRVVPRNVNTINARNPTAAHGACFECGGTDHYKSTFPMLNRAQGLRVNRPNQALAIDGGQGRGNNGNQARGRAFMLGAKEARQDPNIVMGMFTLNNHYATTLFDSGADYSFVSTSFIPLLGIEPSDLRFSYEIEIVSEKLVEIEKVVKGCKLEIDGHVFDINLIPFESKSFDVIIGMDWLSNNKAEIICHEKVVRIPLLDDKVLRVLGERSEEKARHLMSAKAKELKQEEMVVGEDLFKLDNDEMNYELCSAPQEAQACNNISNPCYSPCQAFLTIGGDISFHIVATNIASLLLIILSRNLIDRILRFKGLIARTLSAKFVRTSNQTLPMRHKVPSLQVPTYRSIASGNLALFNHHTSTSSILMFSWFSCFMSEHLRFAI
ncbi:putative reverse transcriptase domain-containing protein [Tanacetum coccineum]